MKNKEISRGEFIRSSSAGALGIPIILFGSGRGDSRNLALTCADIAGHFKATEAGKMVNWSNTTDTFKCGDPSKPVKKVAVAWKASFDALREAFSRGADLFISHESICVNARNGSTEQEAVFALPTEKEKFDWLAGTGLVVYRCHDVWDRFPKTGIRDTWQKGLNIGNKIVADQYPFYVTEVSPVTVGDLASHILKQLKPLGQNGVLVSGNPDKKVTRIGTGTGQTNDAVGLRNAGAEVGVMTDDGYLHVRMGVHARELDFPTIIVNHGVSEEWGMANLARYVQEAFPALEVFHIPQNCPYKVIVSQLP